MAARVQEAIEQALGRPVTRMGPLTGGCVGEVYRVEFEDGSAAVAKCDWAGDSRLDVEGFMLRYLAENSSLPVPKVLHESSSLLLMEFLPGESSFSGDAQVHAAKLLSDLHGRAGQAFGLERDTLIGGLPQANPWTDSWVEFFGESRLLYMARQAQAAGRMGDRDVSRVAAFVEKLPELIDEPAKPSLLHGDVWTTNVLARGGRITGFIDPAVYYGHPEIELAFITLFSTFGEAFFESYRERAEIAPGFFELRRDIYNLYPLLAHTRLFGSSYLQSVTRVLSRHGC